MCNLKPNLIPSPKVFNYSEGKELTIKSIGIIGEIGNIAKNALELFAKEVKVRISNDENADFVVYAQVKNLPNGIFTNIDLKFFEEKYAKEQGYLVKYNGEKIIATAMESQGLAYAILTVLQLVNKNIGNFIIKDAPDFEHRGVEWLIWAETGCWAYDFGDGKDAIIKRMLRKIDMLFKYKINYVYADGFGFSVERFEGYTEIMRSLSDYAKERGIKIATGGYSMGYGMASYMNTFQGKHFLNRKSYPNGEVYDCIGTVTRQNFSPKGRAYGTCLSNEGLFEEKIKELTEYIKKTHVTALYLHNMDADEIYQEFWLVRCEECKKRWPNDSLFAKDGAAGAFAEYYDKLLRSLFSVKDGDYDASKDLLICMVAPGYLYAWSKDDIFDRGIQFWSCVANFMEEKESAGIGFREQFFYHNKNVKRVDYVVEKIKGVKTSLINFNGSDGFYNDQLFNISSVLNYMYLGYDNNFCFNGHAFQEPLAVFNAEYLWNAENSSFYNFTNRPTNYEDFRKLYKEMMESKIRPEEIYGKNGLLDIICQKLYGEDVGLELSKLYKLRGKNGEPPIAYASNVELKTEFNRALLPIRWDNELNEETINLRLENYKECNLVTLKAYEVLKNALENFVIDKDVKEDFTYILECFYMGGQLTDLLAKYMHFYKELNQNFSNGTTPNESIKNALISLRKEVAVFTEYVNSSTAKPLDIFGGIYIRRKNMAEFLEYNTEIMLKSIEQNKRIPQGLKELVKVDWW